MVNLLDATNPFKMIGQKKNPFSDSGITKKVEKANVSTNTGTNSLPIPQSIEVKPTRESTSLLIKPLPAITAPSTQNTRGIDFSSIIPQPGRFDPLAQAKVGTRMPEIQNITAGPTQQDRVQSQVGVQNALDVRETNNTGRDNTVGEFLATIWENPEDDLENIRTKFPEFEGIDTQVLGELGATLTTNPEITMEEIRGKFPEIYQYGYEAPLNFGEGKHPLQRGVDAIGRGAIGAAKGLYSSVVDRPKEIYEKSKQILANPNKTDGEKFSQIVIGEGMIGTLGGMINKTFGEGLNGLYEGFTTESERKVISKSVKNIMNDISKSQPAEFIMNKYNKLTPEQQQETSDLLGYSMNLIDIGTLGIGGKPVTQGAKSIFEQVATKLDDVAKPITKELGTLNPIETIKGLKPNTNKLAEGLTASTFKQPAMREKYISKVGQSPEKTLLENNIKGTIENQTKQVLDKAKESAKYAREQASKIPDTVASPEGVWITNKLIEGVDETIPGIQETLKPIIDMRKRFETGKATTNDLIDAKTFLSRYEQIYDDFGRVKKTGDAFEKESLAKMYSKMKTQVEELGAKYDIDMEKINFDTMKFEGLRGLMTRAMSREANRDILGLSDYVLGGYGAIVDPVSAMVVLGGKKLLQSPNISSKIANSLYKKEGDNFISTMSKNATRISDNSLNGTNIKTTKNVVNSLPKKQSIPALPQKSEGYNLGTSKNPITLKDNSIKPTITENNPFAGVKYKKNTLDKPTTTETVNNPFKKETPSNKNPFKETKTSDTLVNKVDGMKTNIDNIIKEYPSFTKNNEIVIANKVMSDIPTEDLKKFFNEKGIKNREDLIKYMSSRNKSFRGGINKEKNIELSNDKKKIFNEKMEGILKKAGVIKEGDYPLNNLSKKVKSDSIVSKSDEMKQYKNINEVKEMPDLKGKSVKYMLDAKQKRGLLDYVEVSKGYYIIKDNNKGYTDLSKTSGKRRQDDNIDIDKLLNNLNNKMEILKESKDDIGIYNTNKEYNDIFNKIERIKTLGKKSNNPFKESTEKLAKSEKVSTIDTMSNKTLIEEAKKYKSADDFVEYAVNKAKNSDEGKSFLELGKKYNLPKKYMDELEKVGPLGEDYIKKRGMLDEKVKDEIITYIKSASNDNYMKNNPSIGILTDPKTYKEQLKKIREQANK